MDIDPVYLALSKLKKRQFDACIDICTRLLQENPLDQVRAPLGRCVVGCNCGSPSPSPSQAVWFLKCRALTEKAWIDDTEMEEEGVAEVLLDDNATASAPRSVISNCRRLLRRLAAHRPPVCLTCIPSYRWWLLVAASSPLLTTGQAHPWRGPPRGQRAAVWISPFGR